MRGLVRSWAYAVLPSLLALSTASAPAAPVPAAPQWPLDARHFNAPRVWSLSQGEHVTVAVVDTGVNARHPDLSGRVLPGTDLTHQAASGQVDLSGDSHGTSVAGVIAGDGTDGAVAGLAPRASLLPVRVSVGAAADPLTLAEGIVYAARHGADVINVSMVTTNADPQLRDAVAYAVRHDIVVVAAAGNNGRTGNPVTYPAAFPGVLAVSGTTREGTFWQTSESGPYVALAGPAVGIYSTGSSGGHLTEDGTSYSAPYVAATAALLRSRYPEESAGQIVARLIDTADRSATTSRRDGRIGYGIVDPLKALRAPEPASRTNPLLSPAAPAADSGSATGWGPTVWTAGGAGAAVLAAAAAVLARHRRRTARTR
ncbi:S8 family serine peptidase [Streptomyces griseorubiginosus]|uniref:S8 family serine peptidase n=1 Tax=Streptomyces griseorubiginosus TaxID=67304 RepID=UPI001AD717BD|nr:S8 family serine peptidase [Streptomyces griseorubiginosus]MBO4256174.1 S8 family serine peptidase [Streptomyces griseorubiginosus]